MTFILMVGLFVLGSCDKKNDPTPNPAEDEEVSLQINSISLQDWTVGSELKFEESWSLNLQHADGSSPITFLINPNSSPIPERIEVKKGTYRYSFESASAPTFSDYLPVKLAGEFEAETPNQPVNLTGVAKSKGIVIQLDYDSSPPKLAEPQLIDFYSLNSDYYLYYNTADLLKISIPLPESQGFLTQFHLGNTAPLSTRYQVAWPENNDFYENSIKLDENKWPLTLIPTTVSHLEESQNETSGLAWIAGNLFSINDGENTNEIHQIDPFSGEVVRSIEVANATNVDWEDLAQSSTHLFIGDFGNNMGNRKDLSIYKVLISDLLNQDAVQAEKISFNYPNQTDFSPNNMNHEFDCEAMVFQNDKLHLFTKNWVSESTDHYVLPSEKGNYTAEFLENLPLTGLLTAADLDPVSGQLILMGFRRLGSNPLEQWLWFYRGLSETHVQGEVRKTKIGIIPHRGFPEGIAFWEKGNIWISSERFVLEGVYNIPPQIGIVGLEGLF
ncbi:hypothetical protein [Algoriphagus sp.]|uniref:hypothetical protein n=1 Tax=Algoriphagus sp. TaxID=1872435 RepID=UPI0026229B20|nr:hypothetical protein [Algoriphagus sp.]